MKNTMDNTDHFYLERHDIKRLQNALNQLIDIWPTLEATLVKQNKFNENPHTSKTGRIDTPLPFHVGASNHRTRLAIAVNAIAEAVTLQRKLNPPTYDNPLHTILWIKDHIIDLALCEDAQDYATQLHHLTHQTFYIVDRPKPLTLVGVCDNCNSSVYADTTTGLIPCPYCGELQDATHMEEELNRQLEHSWCTRDQAADFFKARGIAKSTRNAWLHDIVPTEVNGKKYWKVADLINKVRNKGKHNRNTRQMLDKN